MMPDRRPTFHLTLTVGFALVAARLAVVAARAADGLVSWPPRLSAWPAWLAALLSADALCLTVFLIADQTIGHRRRPARALLWFGALLGIAYTAFNVPAARVLGSPITAPMMDAAGGELGDSIRVYLTPPNLLLLAVPVVAAALSWQWLRQRGVAASAASPRDPSLPASRAAHASLIVSLVPVTAAIVISVGLGTARLWDHGSAGALGDNAILTFARTWLAEQVNLPFVADTLPELPPLPDLEAEAGSADPAGSGTGPTGNSTATPNPSAKIPATSDAAASLRALKGRARGWNVIWVVMESTGARYLGVYGGAPDPMPNLAQIARHSLVLSHAYAAYPESVKGLMPTLCGIEPAGYTAAARYVARRLPCDALPELLRRHGYYTALFQSGWFHYLGLGEILGGRGFDWLADAGTIGGEAASSFGTDESSAVGAILSQIDRVPADQPFFVMYLNIAGHHPYDAPGTGPRPFGERDDYHRYLSDLYTADEAIGQLWAGVGARKRARPTLWVFIGDHGQAFQQHPGNIAHSLFLYEENVHVPLVISLPEAVASPILVPAITGAVDVAPTVMDLLGIAAPTTWVGTSALGGGGELDGDAKVARFYTDHTTWQLGLRHGRWKFIHDLSAGRSQLFDLQRDPGETTNVAAANPALADAYRRYLAAWSDRTRRRVLDGNGRQP